ncbi:MAG: hypothetical protein J3Q66DRAFT_339068 [Benniella sp.]|nr:MAG: hypothetical protein J3Q66DRAFT_339068 [Benniella sp.]
MKERDRERYQRERQEREIVARATHEVVGPNPDSLSNQSMTTTATLAQSTGTALWNRFRTARDVINTTILGEERWPDSDESDYEGESHVSRILREYTDEKEAHIVAVKIAALDRLAITPPITPVTPISPASPFTPSTPLTPITPTTPTTPAIPERSESIAKHQDLREAIRKNIRVNTSLGVLSRTVTGNGDHHHHHNMYSPSTLSPLTSSPTTPGGGTKDNYGQLLRGRSGSGHHPSRLEGGSRNGFNKSHGHGATHNNTNNSDTTPPASTSVSPSASTLAVPVATNGRVGNRFRTSSDASLSEALGRLEGKRNQDALLAQVSHLGSTRARSPHRGQRAYRDHIDVVPPPPLPTPKSEFRQQFHLQQQQQKAPSQVLPISNTTRRAQHLGTHGQRKQQPEQQPSQYI